MTLVPEAEPAGLLPVTLRTTASGDACRLDAGGLSLLQYPASEAESGPAGVHLRLRRPEGTTSSPLTGPASGGTITADGTVSTDHGGLRAHTRLHLLGDDRGWAWTVRLRNEGADTIETDLLHTLDAALAPLDDVRRNEQYIAQYLDLTPVSVPAGRGGEAGTVLAIRQNMPDGRVPWAVVGTTAPTAQWATDALQLLDRGTGEGLDPSRDLPCERLQHEHTLAALRTAPEALAPGEEWTCTFWGTVVADHPSATSDDDAALIADLRDRLNPSPAPGPIVAPGPEAGTAGPRGAVIAPSLLATAPPLPVLEAGRDHLEEIGGALRLLEEDGTALLSAFADRGHLVTAAKESRVLRPHGHIQQAVASAEADLSTVASTVWMRGVFCSQLTLGHASAEPLTSVRRSYLGLRRVCGARLLHRDDEGRWSLLSTPSVWRTGAHESEWLYLTGAGAIRIRSAVRLGAGAEIEIDNDAGGGLLLVVDGNGDRLDITARAGDRELVVGDDSTLFGDATSHGTGLRTVELGDAPQVRVLLGAEVRGDAAAPGSNVSMPEPYAPRLPRLTGTAGATGEIGAVDEMLGWLAQNASVHFRSPRGLEQFTGGAWGTRDVCQGPVGLLLATDEHDAFRSTLLAVLAAQQTDGTWPQWFDYLPGHRGPGRRDAHGDVVYWPLLALGEHLAVTGDHTVLEEPVTWTGASSIEAATPVLDHVSRALEHIAAHRTADPRLPAYGHGDWNDSLQPARPELARRMCSTWTTELEIKALTVLAHGLEGAAPGGGGRADELARRCREIAGAAEEALHELLVVDGELAGYALVEDGGVQHLVHPTDTVTGLRHGSLQMIHALADELLEPQQARHHLALIREHLAGPTGLYLFDRPVEYHGGVMTVFQRAETATFWGREIGLMYMHAHLRFIEALTHLGEAETAWEELLKAVPIGLEDRVPGARPRQANCYYSSSDAVFPDRSTASANAEALFDERTGFEGGWRVYSSGPGLLLRIVVEDLLGIRQRAGALEVDPVIPAMLDGLRAEIPYGGGHLTVHFRRGARGCGVRAVHVDGVGVTGRPLHARYREAGVAIEAALVAPGSTLEVVVG